jgi:hypothetical protein
MTRGMIRGDPDPPFADLAARLARRARALAEARAAGRQAGERRWRRAGLLWPLFPKG